MSSLDLLLKGAKFVIGRTDNKKVNSAFEGLQKYVQNNPQLKDVKSKSEAVQVVTNAMKTLGVSKQEMLGAIQKHKNTKVGETIRSGASYLGINNVDQVLTDFLGEPNSSPNRSLANSSQTDWRAKFEKYR